MSVQTYYDWADTLTEQEKGKGLTVGPVISLLTLTIFSSISFSLNSGAALQRNQKEKGTYAAPEREKDRKRKLLALDAFILISCRSKYLYFIFLISELRQDIRE